VSPVQEGGYVFPEPVSLERQLATDVKTVKGIIEDAYLVLVSSQERHFDEAEDIARAMIPDCTTVFGDNHLVTQYARRLLAAGLFANEDDTGRRREGIETLSHVAVDWEELEGHADVGQDEERDRKMRWSHDCLLVRYEPFATISSRTNPPSENC
jgi:hypothetical protein